MNKINNLNKEYFITIIHNKENDYCKLLLLYYNNLKSYWSSNKEYKELIYFKKPSKIEMKNENEIILFSKNGTTILFIVS